MTTAIDLIKLFEGFRAEAYKCPAGIWTIGYGTIQIDGQPVREGMTISREQALQYAQQEVNKLTRQIHTIVAVPLNDNQLNALVDFAYNLGFNALKTSTLIRKLNAGDYNGAADQFDRWVYAGGKVLPGLVKRREAEKQLFNAPC